MKKFLNSLRPYQLLYAISIYFLVGTMFARVGRMFLLDNAVVYEIYNFCLVASDGTVTYPTVWLVCVLITITILTLVGFLLSFCSKFKLQKRLAVCSMVLIVGYYVAYALCLYFIFNDYNDVNTLNLDDARIFSPLLVLILNVIIFFVVRRKQRRLF